ncbi:MAG TPA: MFS transporter, partial [Saprospiraceae bacterium]|nr:MFS transporter [Saprospiraceae bacterium]
KDIGLLYGWIGIWMAATQGILVRRLAKYIPSADVITVSMVLRGIALFLILLPNEGYMFYVLTPLIAISQGMTGPNLTAVVSEQATPDQQGQVLGINQSMQSIGQAVPPVIAGYINSINGNLPIITAGVITFIAWIVYLVFFWRKQRGGEKTTGHSES